MELKVKILKMLISGKKNMREIAEELDKEKPGFYVMEYRYSDKRGRERTQRTVCKNKFDHAIRALKNEGLIKEKKIQLGPGKPTPVYELKEDIETFRKIYKDHQGLIHDLQKSPLVIDLLLKHTTLLIQTDVIKKLPKYTFDIFDGLSARKGPFKNIMENTRLDRRINHFHIEFLKKCLKISPAFFKHVIKQNTGGISPCSPLSQAWGIFKHCVEEDRIEKCKTKEGAEMFDCVTGVEMFIEGYYNYQQQFNRITRIIEEFCPPVGNTEEKMRRLERVREYEKNNFIPTKRDLALELVLGGVENIQNTLKVFIVSKNLREYLYRELLGSAYDDVGPISFPLPWSLRVSSNFSIPVDYFKHPPSKEDLVPKLAEFLEEENKS